MNQEILENDKNEISPSSGLLRWIIIAVVVIIIFGGSFWYYQSFIKPKPEITPEPTFTEAIWKTKSEKTVNDFLTDWSSAIKNKNIDEAKKARDLLTNAAQAQIQILKNPSGQAMTDLDQQLTAFLLLDKHYDQFQLVSSTKIDENIVDVLVKFNYNETQPIGRILTIQNEEGFWLINKVTEAKISPNPISSLSPSIKPSPSR